MRESRSDTAVFIVLCWLVFINLIFTCMLLKKAENVAYEPETQEQETEHEPQTYDLPETAVLIQENVPDVCEDTYLRDDVPLTYAEQAALYGACLEFGVDYPTMLALIDRETDFRNVTGDGGDSQGYCQIQSKWWGDLMADIGADDLTDPEDNFRTACAIVAQLTAHYGSLEDALTAYNRGTPGSSDYSRCILASAETWR